MTIKLMICGRRRPGQTLAEHSAQMKDRHAKLALDYVAQQPSQAPRPYIQNHAFDGVHFGGEELPKAFANCFNKTPGARVFPDTTGPASQGLPGYCRNTPLFPEPIEAIEEYWLADDAAGVAFVRHCRDAIHGPVRSDEPRFSITIARELILHVGRAGAGQERHVHEHPRS